MTEFNQFGNKQPSRSPDPDHCAQCEAMLTDALDRTLSQEDQALFDRHLAICPDCSRMFIDARQGADLLEKLHDSRPEPSSALLERILSSTGPAADLPAFSSTQQSTLLNFPAPLPVMASGPSSYGAAHVIPFHKRFLNALRPQAIGHTLMQPRLAMTAAMAFFSIALTLSLTGVRITQLRASDFTPSSIKRSFYDTNARVVRSIDNLRVVYELESRVRDLQRDSDSNQTPAPVQNNPGDQNNQKLPEQQNQEQRDQPKQSAPRPRSGSSRSLNMRRTLEYTVSLAQPGFSPEPGLAPRQGFVIFTPTVFNPIKQGGQA